MRAIALVFAAAALVACQTPCPPGPNAAETVTRTFACEDGSSLQVTFSYDPNRVQVVQEGFPTLELPPAHAGGGYRYAGGGADLRGRTGEARWQRPGAADTLCRETQ